MRILFSLSVALFFWVACSSKAVYVENLEYSLLDIQKAVAATMPVGILETSDNQREYSSQAFRASKNGREYPISEHDKDRLICRITVLGDRRPYRVKYVVIHEQKVQGNWSFIGENPEIAVRVSERLSDYLSRNSQKNLIDHFRPF